MGAVCSKRKTLWAAGSSFPQPVVRLRLLKLESEYIRFVFVCLKKNTTQINMKQYLLAVMYNAPTTIALWRITMRQGAIMILIDKAAKSRGYFRFCFRYCIGVMPYCFLNTF